MDAAPHEIGDDYRDLVLLAGELRLALLEEGAGPFQTVAGPGEAAGQAVGLPAHFPIGKGTFVGYFMGRSVPPGRRGTQRDVGPNVNDLGASAATTSGGPLRPTEGRALRPARRRRKGLMVPHTMAAIAPNEPTAERGEMGVKYRDLV